MNTGTVTAFNVAIERLNILCSGRLGRNVEERYLSIVNADSPLSLKVDRGNNCFFLEHQQTRNSLIPRIPIHDIEMDIDIRPYLSI